MTRKARVRGKGGQDMTRVTRWDRNETRGDEMRQGWARQDQAGVMRQDKMSVGETRDKVG